MSFARQQSSRLEAEKVDVKSIGEVELDEDEIALLSLPPKFAIRRRLKSIDMKTDAQMALAKCRYQIHREEQFKDEIVDENNDDENMMMMKRRKQLTNDELDEIEKLDEIEAEGRRIYDPINKIFDHGNKRCTDMVENKKVNLPKPVDCFSESSMKMLYDKIMKTFYEYRAKKCTENGDQTPNLTPKEIRGLRKLRKRVQNKSIVVLKTDKSGKLTTMKRELYEKMGLDNCKKDKPISRKDVVKIERRLNEQVRFWARISVYIDASTVSFF